MQPNTNIPQNENQPQIIQPQVIPQFASNPVQATIPNHLVMAIVSCFAFLPLAIPAIINANKVNDRLRQNDFAGAQIASKNAKKWSIGAFIAAAICIVVLIPVMLFTLMAVTSPQMTAAKKVSGQELTYISDGDTDAAYSLTSADFKAATSRSDFDSFVTTYKVLPLASADLTDESVKVENTSGTASFSYSTKVDNSTYIVKTDLTKSDSDWQIDHISIKTQ